MLTVLYMDQLQPAPRVGMSEDFWQKSEGFRDDVPFAKTRCNILRQTLGAHYEDGADVFTFLIAVAEQYFWEFIKPYNDNAEKAALRMKSRCLCGLHVPGRNPPKFRHANVKEQVETKLKELMAKGRRARGTEMSLEEFLRAYV